jgi:predicted negative regulator of RcsB-dependent stress response/predicted porin
MRKIFFLPVFIVLANLLFVAYFIAPACAAGKATLEDGIAQYKEENYEEAIELLTQVRQQEPGSSEAAFFLGMAHKQILDFPKAEENLRDAVTLTPKIKEALLDLADVLYQQGKLEESKHWIDIAEKEHIFPARTAFFKGLILVKENKNNGAIAAFEEAKKLDPSFTQAAEFQIGVCLIKEKKLDLAKARFQAVVTSDPLSDLAAFAREYQEMVNERLYIERPLHLTVGILGGYDTNIVSRPVEAIPGVDITDEAGSTLSTSVRLDYTPKIEGPWLFNARYSAASAVNSKHTHSHDSFANSFSASPGYNFGRFAVNLNASYTNVLLRTDPNPPPTGDTSPGYKRYLDYTSIGPAIRAMVNQNNIVEFFAGYDKKNFHNQSPTGPDGVRDSVGPRVYVSWIWLFRENSFLNLRYDYSRENTDGRNWKNKGDRLTANVSFPVLPKEAAKRVGPVTMQLTGSLFLQNYANEVKFSNVITETRKDKVYTGSVGLTWKFWKHASLIAQYTRTESNSNVSLYEYNRDQYQAGFEFRY